MTRRGRLESHSLNQHDKQKEDRKRRIQCIDTPCASRLDAVSRGLSRPWLLQPRAGCEGTTSSTGSSKNMPLGTRQTTAMKIQVGVTRIFPSAFPPTFSIRSNRHGSFPGTAPERPRAARRGSRRPGVEESGSRSRLWFARRSPGCISLGSDRCRYTVGGYSTRGGGCTSCGRICQSVWQDGRVLRHCKQRVRHADVYDTPSPLH